MPVGLLVARRRGDSISLARAEDLRWDLYLGPWPSSFGYDATDEELLGAWLLLGDEILADWLPGSRPWAWWQFEAREDRPSSLERAGEVRRLLALDALTAEEQRRVVDAGVQQLAFAPFSDPPVRIPEANAVLQRLGEPLLPVPMAGAIGCDAAMDLAYALLGTHTYTDQDDQ
jgi:hypothetical protein